MLTLQQSFNGFSFKLLTSAATALDWYVWEHCSEQQSSLLTMIQNMLYFHALQWLLYLENILPYFIRFVFVLFLRVNIFMFEIPLYSLWIFKLTANLVSYKYFSVFEDVNIFYIKHNFTLQYFGAFVLIQVTLAVKLIFLILPIVTILINMNIVLFF